MEETKVIDISQRLFMLLVGLIAIIAIFMLGQLAYQFQSLPQNAPYEVSVNGEGKAYAKPDVAIINFGTHTESQKSQDAVNKNNAVMNKVIEEIKKLGVEDKDIQTTLYNLSLMYEFQSERLIYPPIPGKRVFKGYSLDQQIQVKIRNFDNISAILDAASASGPTTIGELQFTVDDMEKVRAEARAKAIAQAKEKAQSLFAQSGLKSLKLVRVDEGFAPPLLLTPFSEGIGGGSGERSVTPDIQPGQTEVQMTVTLTYRVK